MGRYYSGDIEGKFWFGIQDSNDASFFGGQESEPNYINYYFEDSDLESIKGGIEKCNTALGENKNKLAEFFNLNRAYTDESLAKYLKTSQKKTKELLEWYARLSLGNKILACVEKNGSCSFEAEL